MDLKQLKYFYQVYQDKSTQRAARNLIVSQQAVSQLVRNLEEELGVPLFVRSNTGLIPTEHGDFLAKEAEAILQRIHSATHAIQSGSGMIQGSVSIGFLMGHLGPKSKLNFDALYKMQQHYPNISLRWAATTPQQCEKQLRDELYDFAFSAFPADAEQFVYTKMFEFEWVILMRPNHPLARKSSIRVEDLEEQKIIMPEDEQHDRQQIMRALPSSHQPVFITPGGSFFDMIFQNILGDGALMICAEPHVLVFNPQILRAVPFHTNLLRSQIYLLEKKGRIPTPAALFAKDFLLREWGFPSSEEE